MASHIKKFGLLYGFLLGKVMTLLIVSLLIWFALLDAPMPWKVTDPSDPKFDPMKFEYTDYHSNSEFRTALKIMFPLGTEKSYIDKILVEVGGGTVRKYNYKHESLKDKITYRYGYNNIFRKIPMHIIFMPIPLPPAEWPSHYVAFDFNEDNKVERISVMSSIGLPVNFHKKSKQHKTLERILKEL